MACPRLAFQDDTRPGYTLYLLMVDHSFAEKRLSNHQKDIASIPYAKYCFNNKPFYLLGLILKGASPAGGYSNFSSPISSVKKKSPSNK